MTGVELGAGQERPYQNLSQNGSGGVRTELESTLMVRNKVIMVMVSSRARETCSFSGVSSSGSYEAIGKHWVTSKVSPTAKPSNCPPTI